MNKVELVGRITRDPVVNYTKNTNTPVTVFSIAIDRPTQDKATDYPRVKVLGKQAETIAKYMKKGFVIAVEGSLETGSYDGKNGKAYYTLVKASRVEFIGNNPKREEPKQEEPEAPEYDDFEQLDADVPF